MGVLSVPRPATPVLHRPLTIDRMFPVVRVRGGVTQRLLLRRPLDAYFAILAKTIPYRVQNPLYSVQNRSILYKTTIVLWVKNR